MLRWVTEPLRDLARTTQLQLTGCAILNASILKQGALLLLCNGWLHVGKQHAHKYLACCLKVGTWKQTSHQLSFPEKINTQHDDTTSASGRYGCKRVQPTCACRRSSRAFWRALGLDVVLSSAVPSRLPDPLNFRSLPTANAVFSLEVKSSMSQATVDCGGRKRDRLVSRVSPQEFRPFFHQQALWGREVLAGVMLPKDDERC
jgi:hypothetical protein